MKTIVALAVIVASAALVPTAQANQRAAADWWRVDDSRLGATVRPRQNRYRPQVRGFHSTRRSQFDPQARYDFGGMGLPDWAVEAFQPANRR